MEQTFIGYCRVSEQYKDVKGLAIDDQIQAIKAYVDNAKARLISHFSEIDSGYNLDRPQLQTAIVHAYRSRSKLIVATMDRLGRTVEQISSVIKKVPGLVICDEQYLDKLTLHLLAAFVEHTSRKPDAMDT